MHMHIFPYWELFLVSMRQALNGLTPHILYYISCLCFFQALFYDFPITTRSSEKESYPVQTLDKAHTFQRTLSSYHDPVFLNEGL